ncbi:MAG: class I SAM-dependent methyltransferase [Verrucomicrobia bacterium]|nr:class I SAM-dependent methyltransferase [Verrucomicrobiota bacterium]
MNPIPHPLRLSLVFALALPLGAALRASEPRVRPDHAAFSAAQAERMRHVAATALAPVYPFLADYIVDRFDLADRAGIGVDIGGGSGRLVVELCRRTPRYYWINTDLNTHHAAAFWRETLTNGCAHRVALLFADAQHLPFRDDYADLIVSRGSFPFWDDPQRGFAEVYRVLKPGGQALIGRGFPPNVPLDVARQIRRNQSKGEPKYDVRQSVEQLRRHMAHLRIDDHEIFRPRSDQAEVNYGVWVRFSKPRR